MSFIPKELHELHRQCNIALGIVTLSHPEQASVISLYLGKIEMCLYEAVENAKVNS